MSAPTSAPSTLSDSAFHVRSNAVLAAIESALDRWLQDDVIDIDSHRTGGLLELQIPGGGKIVVNTQPPLHELWLAARNGGYHFRWMGERWVDSREGGEFFAVLSREISAQAGRTLSIASDN
jgi:CyaY protein